MSAVSLAIGGGKGGTGKSLVAVQLAILMAEMGVRVVLVDLDPNGANLHTFVGLEDPQFSVADVLLGEKRCLQVILPTGFRSLGMIAGMSQDMRVSPSESLVPELFKDLSGLEVDILLIDVGSGVRPWQTQLFSLADVGILVSAPTYQSMERDFFFLRQVCAWRLDEERERICSLRNWLPVPWLASFRKKDPQKAKRLRLQLSQKPVLFLMNGIRLPDEDTLDQEMAAVARRFMGLSTVSLGCMEFDERLLLAVHSALPVVKEYPDSRWVQQMKSTVDHLTTFLIAEEEKIQFMQSSEL